MDAVWGYLLLFVFLSVAVTIAVLAVAWWDQDNPGAGLPGSKRSSCSSSS